MTSEITLKDNFLSQIDEICEDTGLSRDRAFPRWVCENILFISDSRKIDEATSIGGKNDYAIDIFHIDENADIDDQCIYWAQVKFSDNLDHLVIREGIESFVDTISYLQNCPHNANPTFKQKSNEFVKIIKDNPDIKKKMIFAVTGKLNDQARELVENQEWLKKLKDSNVLNIEFEVLDLEKIYSSLLTHDTAKLTINFDGNVIVRHDLTTGKDSITGYIKASDIVQIVKTHNATVFLENPRESLGTTPTNRAIMSTLKNDERRKKFWKLNNGITAVCSTITSTTSTNKKEYNIENFKIVNGRQTTSTLGKYTGNMDDVSLSITIHEAVSDEERNDISQGTNTQNPIKPVDLVTNYKELRDLVLQCKTKFKEFYFERQTKGFKAASLSIKNHVTPRRVLEKNPTARVYYAYNIDPNLAIMSDKNLFQKKENFDKAFKNKKIDELIVPHIFMQMLKEYYDKQRKELKENPNDKTLARNKGILSKDIVKYYILRFIHKSMASIDTSKRKMIEYKMIDIFRKLNKKDETPEIFSDIARVSFGHFMFCFNSIKRETWPTRFFNIKYNIDDQGNDMDKPTPYEIMYKLKLYGKNLIKSLLNVNTDLITRDEKDPIKSELLRLIEMDST